MYSKSSIRSSVLTGGDGLLCFLGLPMVRGDVCAL
jgi:hypothetical protein